MQEIKSRRSVSKTRKSFGGGDPRQKSLRKPRKTKKDITTIVADGLYSLILLPKVEQSKQLGHLVPAYLKFVELFSMTPVNLDVINPIKAMLDHINSIFGGTKTIDIIEDEKNCSFIYKTIFYEPEEYNIIIYGDVMRALEGSDQRYLEFFDLAINMLLSRGVNDWQDYYNYCIDWMDDNVEQLLEYHGDVDGIDEEYEERRYELRILKEKYESGEAYERIRSIKEQNPDIISDQITVEKYLDPNHPIVKFYKDALTVYQLGECLYDFVDKFEEDHNPLFSFAEQFCIVYELDEVFDEWEEYVNSNANEGIGNPTSTTFLTPDMASVPVHNSKFPGEIFKLFNMYYNLSSQIEDYGKNNRKDNTGS